MWRGLLITVLMVCGLPALAWRAQLPGATPVGQGEFRKWGFHVYDATLWAPGGSFDPQRPFALELRYFRSIRRDQFVSRSLDEIEKVHPELLTDATRADWTAAMRRAFADVKEGDRLTGLFLPGRGARFFLGEQPTGDVDDPVFAKAFFDIWLSPATSAPRLREQLLGGGR